MRTLKPVYLVLIPLLFLGGYAVSQPAERAPTPSTAGPQRDPVLDAYISRIRADLSAGKSNLINEIMKLTPVQAAAFWPVYAEYEEDLFALGDRRVDLIKRFTAAQSAGKIDDSTAHALASDWLALLRDAADLMQTYYTQLSKEVSPLHAAQFLQIEHRTNTVIDLMIASELPLIMEPAPAGAGKE